MLQAESILRRCSDVRHRRIEPDSLVIRQSAPEVLVLNGIGGRVLELIDGSTPVSKVVEKLENEYDVEPEQLAREVFAFLDELLEAKLVELVSTAP